MEDLDRAARLAQLVRQIAAVGPDGRSGPTASDDPSAGHGGGVGSAVESPQHADDADAAQAAHGDAPTGATRRTVTGLNRTPEHARARDICLRLLAAMPRPRATLEQALRKREIPEDVAAEVLDRLEELRYVDDAAYAAGYVRAKHRDRALGRNGLRQELRRQGVDPEHIAAAVDQVDDQDEWLRAEQWVAKKLRSALQAGPEAARRRLLGQLARRGYSAEIAFAVVDSALREHGECSQVAEDTSTP